MPNPTPQRQHLKAYPTPKVADVIVRDTRENTRFTIPAYGTAHPDAARYPNHKLVHIKPMDDQGLWYELWYAADRANQEDYNYTLDYPYGGETAYPRITRTYVLPRGQDPLPLGSIDPGASTQTDGFVFRPSGDDVFRPDGTSRIARPGLPDAVLVSQSERPLGDELNGYYVQVTRVYDVIPGLDDAQSGSGAGQIDNGYTISRPIQDKDFVRLTWRLQLPRTIAETYRRSNLETCPIEGFENLRLITEEIKAADDNNQVSEIVRVYEGNVSGAPFPSVPVVAKELELPGITPPEKFLLTIQRRDDTRKLDTPENVDLSVVTAPSGAVLAATKVSPEGTNSGNRIDSSTIYDTPGTLSGKAWDDNLRDYVPYTTTVMSPADAAALVVNDGEEVTITPISRYWSMVTTEAPVATTLGDTKREYFTTMAFGWPAVLKSYQISEVGVKDPRTGEVAYNQAFFDYELKRAWSGICKAKVQIAWSKTAPTFEAIEAMTPTAIDINWPIGRFAIPACLHPEITFSGTTGTEHPTYDYAVFTKTIESTNFIDWPDSLVVDFSVKPYKGGYLQRKVSVYKPY